MVQAVFPGSFDPPTLGHLNLIGRGAAVFDELVVVIAENRQKKALFSAEERRAMMEELARPWANVPVLVWEGLLAEFMGRRGFRVLLRGVRGMDDFAYELELSLVQQSLGFPVETVFMGTAPAYFACRSSTVKELASFGADYSWMVPPLVTEAMRAKFPPRGGS
ncbi:MAG: pantetheine-phosphate adenylyltransferase [Treponema sp.]|jgi:pantetheine-phosphate adenylyltransferase|nr:pantetheine-phosphate adenylyltransferase [Treponema sp.]